MSVETKAIIRKDVTLQELKKKIEEKYGQTTVYNTHRDDFFELIFNNGNDKRILSVFFNDYALNDYKIDGILLSLGHWGNSVQILRFICEEFGGHLLEKDSDDNEFYPINIEKFEASKQLTEKDKFVNEVIFNLGYNNINKALELFEKYKTLF